MPFLMAAGISDAGGNEGSPFRNLDAPLPEDIMRVPGLVVALSGCWRVTITAVAETSPLQR